MWCRSLSSWASTCTSLAEAIAALRCPPSGTASVYKVATYLTRLETRTKESNMLASEWVMLNPDAE